MILLAGSLLTLEYDAHLLYHLCPGLPFQPLSEYGTDHSIHPEILHSILLHFLDVFFDLQDHSQ